MEKITKNIVNILILILLIIILFKTCKNSSNDVFLPTIVKDTVWVHTDSTILSKPQVVNTIPYAVPIDRWNTEYLPDTSSMAILIKQYEALVRELLAKNIHSDSIKIDSIGHVYITDTVSKNQIVSRTTHYNLKYPIITNTVTLPAAKTRALYGGVGVRGVDKDLINTLHLGLMYKNKQDFMFGPSLDVEQNGDLKYGFQMYWNLTKKKN